MSPVSKSPLTVNSICAVAEEATANATTKHNETLLNITPPSNLMKLDSILCELPLESKSNL